MQVKPLSVFLTFIAPGPRTEYRSSINICTTNEWILKSTIWREARKYQALALRCSPFIRARAAQRGGKDTVQWLNRICLPSDLGGRAADDAHIFPFIRQIWSENWVRQSYLPEAGVIRAGMAGKEKPGLSPYLVPLFQYVPYAPVIQSVKWVGWSIQIWNMEKNNEFMDNKLLGNFLQKGTLKYSMHPINMIPRKFWVIFGNP